MLRRVSTSTEIPAGRLVLRHPRWSDYDAWADIRQRDADHLRQWEPEWSAGHLSRASYRLRLGRFRKMVQGDQAYPFHVFRSDTDTLIGAANLTHVERGAANAAKIGYWVARDHQNRGHAQTAVGALSAFAFAALNLHRLEAAVQPGNAPSVRVLEKSGYQLEGRARGLLKIDGVWADHDIYARLRGDGRGPGD